MALSRYDAVGIQRELDLVRRPRFTKAIGRVAEGFDLEFGKGPVKFKVSPKNWFVSNKSRYRHAALEWLRARPNQPLGLGDLESLKNEMGLVGESSQVFPIQLSAECRRVAQEREDLSRWVSVRTALLDFQILQRPQFPDSAQRAIVGLRRDLDRALLEVSENPQYAALRANGVVRQALETAGLVVISLFPNKPCLFSANLMLQGSLGPAFDTDTTVSQNAKAADQIWSELRIAPTDRFTVVAETRGVRHSGFWVPMARGSNGEGLPGATAAVMSLTGSTVFKHDLPPLTGFSGTVEKRWHLHMETQFSDTLFVSLPLVLPDSSGGQSVPAVLNVNANADVTDGWDRAMHADWLYVGRTRVAQFLEVAYKGCVLMNELSGQQLFPDLPKLLGEWGRLPVPSKRLLEE